MTTTQRDVEFLRQKLAETRAATLQLISTLSDEYMHRHPAPGEWSPHQQLAHLAEMEGIWLDWALTIARNPGAEVGRRGITPTPSVETADQYSQEELLERMARARERTLREIDGLTLEELDHEGTQRWFGPMTVMQCLKAIYRHDRIHSNQILEKDVGFDFPPIPEDDTGE